MGDILSRPVVDKHSERAETALYRVGASAMQGWRRGMEDAHICALDLADAPEGFAFFGVFDGHCGEKAAKFCGEHMARRVVQDPAFKAGNYEEAIVNGFLGIDQDMLNDPNVRKESSGCTAVVALVTPTHIYCGNAGDSRCVLASDGRAVPLSTDHKPTNETELRRIQKAGSFVSCGRVNGNLALSRAIGDFDFKQNKGLPPAQQAITAKPDVVVHEIQPQDEFLILACDGVWDVMSNEQVVSVVQKEAQAGVDLATICEKIFDQCLAPAAPGLGCDNMTMVIAQLKRNSTTHSPTSPPRGSLADEDTDARRPAEGV
eukprot:EG_transcript_11637